MRRIALFVDGSNFFYLQKDCLRWWIDPRKLLDWVADRGELVDATYYASVDPSNDSQQSYIRALSYMGYRVEVKPIKTLTLEDGSNKHKANLDTEIVLDLFNTINSYDEAVLVSGDADFARALQILRHRGKMFLVLSTKGFVANEIRQIAGMHYVDLAELRDLIEKD
jgi:uncharacterized LabA/DUF88 family protein